MPYAPWNAGGYYPFTYGTGGVAPNTTSYGANAMPSGGVPSGQQYNSLPGYSVNPTPQQGNGAYGLVPGPIGIPPSTYEQTTKALPGLATAGTNATNAILLQLQGDISPQALRNMQDAAAQFGVNSGMPGTNATPGTLAFNKYLLGNYRTTEQLQQQGQQNYANLLGAVGRQQIDPALAAEIASHNAQLGAAPNPQAAAEQQLANYFASLNAARSMGLRGQGGFGGGYSPAGGTGIYAPQQPSGLGFGFGSLGQGSAFNPNSNTGGIANYPTPYQSMYPGTSLQGQPSLDSLLGPQNPYYAPDGPIQESDYGFGNDFGLVQPDYSGADWTDYLNF